jgi:hypothetical protein
LPVTGIKPPKPVEDTRTNSGSVDRDNPIRSTSARSLAASSFDASVGETGFRGEFM